MIKSFKCRDTADLFEKRKSRRFSAIARQGIKKLAMLHAAPHLNDLLVPPGNRLEALKGDRAGQHSIRVNDRYRICFIWRDDNAHDVESVDYH